MQQTHPPIFKKTELIKVAKLAKRWGVSRQHVYNLIDQGRLTAFRFGISKSMFIPLCSVESLEVSQEMDGGG